MADKRARNFATIVYPESAPADWLKILAEECVPAMVSPLHDQDTNPTGEPKKAHYHVILCFSGKKSLDQVNEICKKFGGINSKILSNLQGYARYLIHMDNPEKFQYNSKDILNLSGADWSEVVKTSRDRYDTLEEIVAFIETQQMFSYWDLVNYCRRNNRKWFEVCCDNTHFLTGLCKSADWTINGSICASAKLSDGRITYH